MKLKRSQLAIGLIALVLIIDQTLKIWVKLNMRMNESFNVFGEGQSWFQIFFTENPGMAFGIEFGGDYGKLALSLFRIIAVGFITYYLYILIKKKKSYGLIASIALIWAGAVGNIIDSMFYGLIFSSSIHGGVATVTAFGDGYAGFLHGKVVDMLHFPLFRGSYPEWFPFVGGQSFTFFQPIFNIADSSISIGVVLVIIFYRRFFKDLSKKDQQNIKVPDDDPKFAIDDQSDVNKDNKSPRETLNEETTSLNEEQPDPEEGMDIPMDEEPLEKEESSPDDNHPITEPFPQDLEIKASREPLAEETVSTEESQKETTEEEARNSEEKIEATSEEEHQEKETDEALEEENQNQEELEDLNDNEEEKPPVE